MTRAELLALAERVERAEWADLDLDRAVVEAIGWRFPNEGFATTPDGRVVLRSHVPRYTSSLDAAASLVPDGWDWERYRSPTGMAMMVFRDGIGCHGHAATPALALTAAALRALAQEAGDE